MPMVTSGRQVKPKRMILKEEKKGMEEEEEAEKSLERVKVMN